TGDVNFALSNTQLTGPGTDGLANIQKATLTGGTDANAFTVGGWTGTATFDGAGGDDTLTGGGLLANAWTITGHNAGTLQQGAGSVTFVNMPNLPGNAQADSATVNP